MHSSNDSAVKACFQPNEREHATTERVRNNTGGKNTQKREIKITTHNTIKKKPVGKYAVKGATKHPSSVESKKIVQTSQEKKMEEQQILEIMRSIEKQQREDPNFQNFTNNPFMTQVFTPDKASMELAERLNKIAKECSHEEETMENAMDMDLNSPAKEVKQGTKSRTTNEDALLEPRISGITADNVIKKMGIPNGTRVEANGFLGGIWCLWKDNCPSITVMSTSQYFIHLKVQLDAINFLFLTIVYANPNAGLREFTGQEIRTLSASISGPWCLAGYFNDVLYEREKIGGAPINNHSVASFASCLSDCNLFYLGFAGHLFTFHRGNLHERLDRVVCNSAWQQIFPSSSNVYLPLSSSDHYGLWFRPQPDTTRCSKNNYFKFLGSWLNHPDFDNQVRNSWYISSDWRDNMNRTSTNLKSWNKQVFGIFSNVMIALFTLKLTFGRSIVKLLSKRKTIGFNKRGVNG
ncbi:unnamed protein product [Trifolium pratense]|uniref:Uncharacterized protein n=1 Tax=Trifolium pratense TaxID=57577 RepID=A0ACB0J073_TRIPR|nr:unnamed protein product [Trifolium pratense]